MDTVTAVIHVLIVVTHVHSGSVVTMHDFSSQETCENAKKELSSSTGWFRADYHDIVYAKCMPK